MVTFSHIAKVSAILVKHLESETKGVALSTAEAETIAAIFDDEYDIAKLVSIDQNAEALPANLKQAAKADAKKEIEQLIAKINQRRPSAA